MMQQTAHMTLGWSHADAVDSPRSHLRWPSGPVDRLPLGNTGVAMELDLPPAWHCLADDLEAVMTSHPEYDLDDAIEALIWGMEEDADEH